MKVIINKENCIGCGSCSAACPDVFGYNDIESVAEVKEDVKFDEFKTCIDEAIAGCPTEAIVVENK